MSRVEQIEADIQKLSKAELRQIRDWLEDFVEDNLEFTPEFESSVKQSESEMKAAERPRVRKP